MILRRIGVFQGLLSITLVACAPAAAQLTPAEPDPLARIRDAAKSNVQACSTTGENLCEQVAPKIIEGALGESPLGENLRRLTDEIGGRVSGSPELTRAVAWGVAAFRDAGVDVHTEKYTLPATWSEGATHLEVLSPSPFPVRLVSVAWTAGTAGKGLEASVVFAGDGSESDFARIGSSAKGAILLVHSDVLHNWEGLFQEYMQAPGTIARAKSAGAVAILWMSTRERLLLYRHIDYCFR